MLLLWLLILEIDAASRLAAWTARLVCAAVVSVQLCNFTDPAPRNYDWAQHCEPIRRGVPANIPTLPEDWMLEYRGRPRSN